MPQKSQEPNTRRTAAVVERIGRWYDREGRALPWREADSFAWGVLVSEVMLQQTPVDRALPLWREWMMRWPTPGALAAAPQADVVRAWGRLGYPRRAKWLRECAQAIERDLDGEVPITETDLRTLPGVGEYTAAAVMAVMAVMAFAFGRRAVVLDTNVRRVIGRVWRGRALPPGHITRA